MLNVAKSEPAGGARDPAGAEEADHFEPERRRVGGGNTILDEITVRNIIPRLKEAGAQGIVEYPLNKIVM